MSAWLLWRPGGRSGTLANAGQLGGSQAGFRTDFDIAPASPARIAPYFRLTAALAQPHAPEAAIGLSLQPQRSIPVSLAIERRVALDRHARNAFALVAAGGFGPVALPQGLRAEGYGQAGLVGLKQRDAFADGRMTVLHSVSVRSTNSRSPTETPFSVGMSLSGGAQPGLARLDVGPALEAHIAMGERSARITGEWRERVAGNARPGSGFALTLAANF